MDSLIQVEVHFRKGKYLALLTLVARVKLTELYGQFFDRPLRGKIYQLETLIACSACTNGYHASINPSIFLEDC